MEKIPNQNRNICNGPSFDSGTSRTGVNTCATQLDFPDYLTATDENGPKLDSNENANYYKEERLDKRIDAAASDKTENGSYGEPPDGGWGWVITFGAFMIIVIIDGVIYNFGLFFKELYLYYDESKSLTAWIGSSLPGCILVSGPFASMLVSLFGFRLVTMFGAALAALAFFLSTWSPNVQTMIILYGVVGGLGFGMIYLTAVVTIGHYFNKRRALATGIALAGSGVGAISFAPLSEFLINLYSWKGAMWVISAICSNGIAMGALFRPIKQTQSTVHLDNKLKANEVPDRENKTTTKKRNLCNLASIFDYSVLRSISFLLYNVSCCICMLGFLTPSTFIPDHAKDSGMTSQDAVYLLIAISISSSISRVTVGWVADMSWSDTILINSVALMLGGITTVFVPIYKSFGLMIAYCCIFGIAIGVEIALLSIISLELVGREKLTSSYGLVTMFMGIPTFVGPPIAGALADHTGNYKASFYYAGAALIMSGAICLPLRRISRWENRRKNYIFSGIPKSVTDLPTQIKVKCISVNYIREDSS